MSPDQQPLVSIVTPTFNFGRFLHAAVESVAAQSYPRIEHIVMDGGSTDGTVELLQKLEKDFKLKWFSEKDSGVGEAVNKGFALASGDILAFLPADDRYFPYTVEVVVSELMRRPEIGFIYGDMLTFNESKGRGTIHFYPSFRPNYFRRGNWIGQPTVFWRHQVMDQFGGFDESLKIAIDQEYWARIGDDFPGHRIEEVLAWEGDHPDPIRLTASRTGSLDEMRRIRERHYPKESVVARVARRAVDRGRAAFWHRYSSLRFLRRMRSASDDRLDGPWARFQSLAVEIDSRRMLLSLVPGLGRRHNRYVLSVSTKVVPR